MVKPDGFVLVAVLGKEDRPADQIAHQCQKSPADQRLTQHRVSRQIDVSKAVQTAVAHFGPLGCHIQHRKKGGKMQGNQKDGREHHRRAGRQHQNRQHRRQGEEGIPHTILKIDKTDAQHHAEQRHRQRGVVGAEHLGQQTDKHNGKPDDQRRAHRNGGPVVYFFLFGITGSDLPLEYGRVQLQCIIKFHHGCLSVLSQSVQQVYPHSA